MSDADDDALMAPLTVLTPDDADDDAVRIEADAYMTGLGSADTRASDAADIAPVAVLAPSADTDDDEDRLAAPEASREPDAPTDADGDDSRLDTFVVMPRTSMDTAAWTDRSPRLVALPEEVISEDAAITASADNLPLIPVADIDDDDCICASA